MVDEARTDEDEPQDPWARVLSHLAGRPLVLAAAGLLALLYGSAIYAPLLANDRPYVLEAVDRGGYERARRSLMPIALATRGLVCDGEEAYLRRRTAGSEQTWLEALAAEAGALGDRLEAMRSQLAPEVAAPLAEFARRVEAVVQNAGEGRVDEACAAAGELPAEAGRLRDAFVPHAADAATTEAGVELLARRSYPLFEALSGLEVAFMVLWALMFSWPVWSRLVDSRIARERRAAWRGRKLAAVLASSLLAGGLWQAFVGGEAPLHVSPYKEDLTRGDVQARRAVFPPVAFGFAESHREERLRPPTWTAAAEKDEQGRDVRRTSDPVDETGLEPVAASLPVVVRFGEPDTNSPVRHPLGTDPAGRDLLARILWGGRVSLAVGIVVGVLAGYCGGWVDLVVSRVIEVVLCFPVFFLILTVVALVGPSILNVMLVIGCLRWTGVARLTRGELLRLREAEFVLAARAAGLSHTRIVLRHLLPNAMGPLLVAASFSLAAGILIESALSFLGFGIEVPIPSWGALINESKSPEHWWIQVFPGALIFLTVLATNLVGDALRDVLDPRSRAGARP